MDLDSTPNPDQVRQLQAYRAIIHASLSADEKNEAIRKQSLIFNEIAKSTPVSDRRALLRSHLGYYNLDESESYQRFINDRRDNVEKLLHDLPRGNNSVVELTADQYVKDQQFMAEPACSGKYHSCIKDEVSADDLKMIRNILGEIPSVEFTGLSSAKASLNRGEPSKKVQKISLHSMLGEARSTQSIPTMPGFRTAREELIIQNTKKNQSTDQVSASSSSRALFNYGASKKSLGARRNVRSGFVPPVRQEDNVSPTCTPPSAEPVDERLQNIDPKMVELISSEIMHKYKPIGWNDIAGLEYAKSTIKEAIVWPLLRPDIFTGLRRPPRGVLLFGPPGTGKTLIGKCIASQSKSTFFSISASSLTSKWVGDGEKMVRALFAVAGVHQPSVVFIDEIDSLLSQRSNSEHESSRRLKTEFLVQLDGANTKDEERILIVGATNRPQELDEAARRRLVRRLYIPLPELSARVQILTNLLTTVSNCIKQEDIAEIAKLTDGYSGADMETLCREASMEPIRSIHPDEIPFFNENSVRPVEVGDFHAALRRVRASVSKGDLKQYEEWNQMYGAGH